MAAVASTAVSLYPPASNGINIKRRSEYYSAGKGQKGLITKSVKITGVTAADTIAPSVLGFKTIIGVIASSYFSSTMKVLPITVDPTANSDTGSITVGAGPSNETIYLTVCGEN